MASVNDLWFRFDKRSGEKVRTSRHGRGKRWRVTWYNDAGKPRSEAFHRKTDADRRAATVESDKLRGEYVDPNAGRVRLRRFSQEWLASQTSDPITQRIRETHFRHIHEGLGDYELRALRPSMIQGWLGGMSKRFAPSYVKQVHNTLSQVLSAAVDDGLIVRNPCTTKSVKPPSVPRRKVQPWTSAQVWALLDKLPQRYTESATLAVGVGLRQGEIFALSVDDVDWLRGVLHIQRQLKILRTAFYFARPKGGKTRDVPLPQWVKWRLATYIEEFPPTRVSLPWGTPEGGEVTVSLLFTPGGRARPIHRSTFDARVWTPALKRAGIDPKAGDVRLHGLRHTYASALLERGVSIKAVAAFLGHTDEGFTLRTYTHLMPSSEDSTRKAIDQTFGSTGGVPDVYPASG